MARKSWSFVDAKVRPADILCFVVVGAYLTVICGYLLATRRLSAGLSVGTVMRRVVRSSSLTPSRASRPSMRRPMTAGATPSAWAAAVRLPLAATATNDSICFSRSIRRDYPR